MEHYAAVRNGNSSMNWLEWSHDKLLNEKSKVLKGISSMLPFM